MAKALENAVRAAVVAFVVVGATFLILSGGTYAFAFSRVVQGALLAGVGALVNTLITKPPKGVTNGNYGAKLTTTNPVAPRQIVYGECRVGGTVIYMKTRGTQNSILDMIVAIAGHEIQSIEKIFINKQEITSTTQTVNSTTVSEVTTSDFVNTENENSFTNGRLIRFVTGLGADNQEMNTHTINTTDFTGDHDLKGIAFIHFEMVYDREKLNAVPEISYRIKGKKVVDPRVHATNTAFSNNPALIVRDILKDTRYGLRATDDEINDNTSAGGNFISAANACDVQVADKDGTNHNKFTANGFFDGTTGIGEAIEGILSSCAGQLTYTNGKFNIFTGVAQTPSATITDDDLLEEINLQNSSGLGNIYNHVKPIYIDEANNFTATDSFLRKSGNAESGNSAVDFLAIDTPSGETQSNYKKILEMRLPFTTNDSQAQRLGKLALNYQRRTQTFNAKVNLGFLEVQVGDWVYVTNERLGFTNKTFQVISSVFSDVGSAEQPVLGLSLGLKEIDTNVFAFDTSADYGANTTGTVGDDGTIALSAPTSLAGTATTSLNDDGSSNSKIDVSFTNATGITPLGTEVEIRQTNTFGTPNNMNFVSYPNSTTTFQGLQSGQSFFLRARHTYDNNRKSDYTSVIQVNTAGDTSAPSAPSNLSATDNVEGGILITWTNPSEADFQATKVYRQSGTSTPTNDDNLVATVSGQAGKTSQLFENNTHGVSPSTTVQYFVRAVDSSGNHSSFVGPEAGSYISFQDGGDLLGGTGGGIFTFSASGNLNAPNDSTFNSTFGRQPRNKDLVIVTNTAATPKTQKIYEYGSQTANSTGGGGSFTEKTNSDFITGDLIVQNSITATEIAAQTITASQIASDTITGGQITGTTLAGIFADLGTINAGTINADNITVQNLEADNIKDDGVNETRIFQANILGDYGISAATSGNTFLTTSFQTLESFTLAASKEAGTHAIIAVGDVGGTIQSGSQVRFDILHGGTSVANYTSSVGAGASQAFVLAAQVSASTSQSKLFQLQGKRLSSDTDLVSFNTAIFAIKLTASTQS